MYLQDLYHTLFALPKESYLSYRKKSLVDVDVMGIAQNWRNFLEIADIYKKVSVVGGACGVAACVFSQGVTSTLIFGTTLLTSSVCLGILSINNHAIASRQITEWESLQNKKKIQTEQQLILDFADGIDLNTQNLKTFLMDFFEKGEKIFREAASQRHYKAIFNILNQEYQAYRKEVQSFNKYLEITESTIKSIILEEREAFRTHLQQLKEQYQDNKRLILDCIESHYEQNTADEFESCGKYMHQKRNELNFYEADYAVYLLPFIKNFVLGIRDSSQLSPPELKKFILLISVEIDKIPYKINVPYNPKSVPGFTEQTYSEALREITKTFACVEN